MDLGIWKMISFQGISSGFGMDDALQISEIFGLAEVLKVIEVGDEFGFVEEFLGGEVLKIERIGEHLDELGRVGVSILAFERRCEDRCIQG